MNVRTIHVASHRKGFMAPMVAIALVVVLAALALVLDRLWLDMAHLELTIAAESSALAAARELASDDLLRVPTPSARIGERARETARLTALTNRVAGDPVQLDVDLDGDIRIGRFHFDPDSGLEQFEDTLESPDAVMVFASRTRSRGNPVALFFRELTNQPVGDVVAFAAARVDNHIVGVRPWADLTVPAFPLAILAADPTGKRHDTWKEQIEQRAGNDHFAVDPFTGELKTGSDGIPEIILNSANPGEGPDKFNMTVVELQQRQSPQQVLAQFQRGWTQADLAAGHGQFLLPPSGMTSSAVGTLSRVQAEVLAKQTGQCRICLLYQNFAGTDAQTPSSVQLVGMVAGRVIQVNRGSGDQQQVVFQPGIVVTRTALLAAEAFPPTPSPFNDVTQFEPKKITVTPPNRYLYKLMLTH